MNHTITNNQTQLHRVNYFDFYCIVPTQYLHILFLICVNLFCYKVEVTAEDEGEVKGKAKEEAEKLLKDKGDQKDFAEASSQLTQSLSQLRAIEALKKNIKLTLVSISSPDEM